MTQPGHCDVIPAHTDSPMPRPARHAYVSTSTTIIITERILHHFDRSIDTGNIELVLVRTLDLFQTAQPVPIKRPSLLVGCLVPRQQFSQPRLNKTAPDRLRHSTVSTVSVNVVTLKSRLPATSMKTYALGTVGDRIVVVNKSGGEYVVTIRVKDAELKYVELPPKR